LYSENVGLAIMGEVPLVIVDVQRMGPATGGATTAAQGDVQFVRWCTSGGYPIIALCPATVADCFTLTMRAFDLAERFRCPVFLLTDKEVVSTMDTVETDALAPYPVRQRETAPKACAFAPCDYVSAEENVAMTPFGGPHLLRFTTSTHDEQGYLTKDPAKVKRLNEHLVYKIDAHRDEIEVVRADLAPGAEVLLVSYGITARAVEEAVREARARGQGVSALTLLSLWPLPEAALREATRGVRRVVVAELNDGQLRSEIACLCGDSAEVVGAHRLDGELVTPEQILEKAGLR
jgi:2-oxoglutarate ferredoxin oxidoreductase subunit alpha